MYTAEEDKNDDHIGSWAIFDPDGDWICNVADKFAAIALLSHLNRDRQ